MFVFATEDLRPDFPTTDVLQVTGLCRFSYPTAQGEGFRKTEALYHPARLNHRLWLFANICLPNLLAQSDGNFRLILLIGDQLPEKYRAALQELIGPYDNITLHAAPENLPHTEVCQQVLLHYRDPKVPYVAEFNMDDDDAVAQNFISQLRHHFRSAHLLLEETGHVEIDFCRGFAGLLSQGKIQVKHVLAPHWGLAQAFLMRSDNPLTALNFHHSRYWKNNISLSISRDPMFLRLFHGGNDSETSWHGLKCEKLRPREGRSLIKNIQDRFDFTLPGWDFEEVLK